MNPVPFRTFIQSQLQLAGIGQTYREKFTDPQGMSFFEKAVTHETADPDNNYQELEFSGDGIIKGINSQYVPRRWKNLPASGKKGTREGVQSKIRRILEKRETLSNFALNRGFWDYVKADEDTLATKRKETLEDVYEAFIGALAEVIDLKVRRGMGYMYCYNYHAANVDDLEVDISQQSLDDAITRLGELYKANQLANNAPILKWGDAAYNSVQLYVPIFNQPPQSASAGDVYFYRSSPNKKDGVVYIYNGNKWVNPGSLDLTELQPALHEVEYDEEGKPTNLQMLWYTGVYGFPHLLGKETPDYLKSAKPAQIVADPGKYGAKTIGQGLHFKKTDSKKMAAGKALAYLAERGYSK